jgi:hypothetical protein
MRADGVRTLAVSTQTVVVMMSRANLGRLAAKISTIRQVARWSGVALSLTAVLFAVLTYVGFWNYVRGNDSLAALMSRLDTSYAEVSRQVRPTNPEWKPLLRVIRAYTHIALPKDRQPVVFARFAAVSSAKTESGEWTAPTTPIALLYRELPAPGTGPFVPGRDGFVVGTLGDLHDWIKRDQDDFDFFWRTLIFGFLSVCVGAFLALPERRSYNPPDD